MGSNIELTSYLGDSIFFSWFLFVVLLKLLFHCWFHFVVCALSSSSSLGLEDEPKHWVFPVNLGTGSMGTSENHQRLKIQGMVLSVPWSRESWLGAWDHCIVWLDSGMSMMAELQELSGTRVHKNSIRAWVSRGIELMLLVLDLGFESSRTEGPRRMQVEYEALEAIQVQG